MILARDNIFPKWDGRTAHSTASDIFAQQPARPVNRYGMLVVAAAVAVVFGLGHIALDLQINFGVHQLENLRAQQEALRTANQQMGLKFHQAVKLTNLERVAKERLKMITPEQSQLLGAR